MSAALRRLAVPFAVTFLAAAFLTGLGIWQLQRLAWKEGLIAAIGRRVAASPVELPAPSQWPSLAPDDYEYRHVRLSGRFDQAHEALVFRAGGGAGVLGSGYLVLTPLRLDDGAYVIVNRGFVPLALKEAASRAPPAGETQVTGLMRAPEPRNFFTPADHPERDEWFTRDPALIAARFGLSPAAPFSVDADAAATAGAWPRGGATVLAIPNDHLAYAFTWFGLAATAIGVFAAYALTRAARARLSA